MKFCLDSTFIKPENGIEISNAIILFHGYGGDGKDISTLSLNWKRFLPNTIFICPNGHEPCSINPDYGLFWWLNKTGRRVPNASRDSYCAFGFGSNIIWIEPKFDLVTVVRWIDNQKFDEFCGKVLNSLKD